MQTKHFCINEISIEYRTMEVGELLNFKPVTAPKRPLPKDEEVRGGGDEGNEGQGHEDDPNESYEKRSAKRRKQKAAKAAMQQRQEQERMQMLEAEADSLINRRTAAEEVVEAAADSLEDAAGGESSALDETRLKKLVLNFEKRATKNQELRIKFPDEPTKFLNSEVDLDESIQELRVIATAPDFYSLFVQLQCVQSLLGLLSHENTDISVAVVDLLQELTDIDALNESEEATEALINSLVANQISALLVQNLERLNENVREESDGIHNSLSIVENLVEFRPSICREMADAGLLSWLVKKLKVKVTFDQNKLYASEILSILLQNEPENRKSFVEITATSSGGGGGGSPMDSMLQQLAYYKRHNPNTAEEQEMMENLFDCLCSLLLHAPNRDRFLKGEGLQLMNLMLREKKVSRNGALKVLNHALIGPEGKDNCSKFVDILGLGTIFPPPKKSQRKGVSAEEHEEHVVSIVASLMKNTRGPQRNRLLLKFAENDHEKVERLMEIHFKFLQRVNETEQLLAKEQEDLDEEEVYLRRLSGGLFTLQLVDYIIVDACASAPQSTVKDRVLQILSQRKASIKTIRNVVREYAANVGDTGSNPGGEANGAIDETATEQERSHLLPLVDKF